MASDMDKSDMQGDIWPGLLKKYEEFVLFEIKDAADFKDRLKEMVSKKQITTAQDALSTRQRVCGSGNEVEMSGVNIAFTSKGMVKLDRDELRDDPFIKGMYTDMVSEGRDTDEEWDNSWRQDVHGVLLICGTEKKVQSTRERIIRTSLGSSIAVVGKPMAGATLPKKKDIHDPEHFGFRDGVSQPILKGLDDDKIKEEGVQKTFTAPGTILINNPGFYDDNKKWWEPDWAKNGSYFVLRKMGQDVPKFHKYCENKARQLGFTQDEFEARLVGRWKNGAPVEKYPFESSTFDGNLNDWDYEDPNKQTNCPFAAHIRKTNPRIGVGNTTNNLMMRRGIPYGPVWEPGKNDEVERGLLFTCYQSAIKNGFQFVMNRWVYNHGFPHDRNGQDAIIGQDIKGAVEEEDKKLRLRLLDKKGLEHEISFTTFISVKGGEYFFTPPLQFIRGL
ncbi:Dyp-type peroxidase [Aspergillus campestris IBT 28561]|uniref:Dyp-type peroxidase n=1 Tax=Aspergillus campestris (strain IBT 28561) TaxID=1392248 RepID=A0A2I1CXN2_ASPC2|nr:Dyp-type peroxidase [Aspergillus campestris IBT 28561]PKY02385.1 Dyp-type peroxidase [Aspergillus campestris IBT 28561]